MVDDAEELTALLVTWTELLAGTESLEVAELLRAAEEEMALVSEV
jgi:hypothetical protein